MNYARLDTYGSLYERDREAALERAFDETSRHLSLKAGVFTWVSAYGQRLPLQRYGMYRKVTREELSGRRFEIQLTNFFPSILWLDVVYNEKTYRHVPLTDAEYDFDKLILPNAIISSFGQAKEPTQ